MARKVRARPTEEAWRGGEGWEASKQVLRW
jgi:hypothetical protein